MTATMIGVKLSSLFINSKNAIFLKEWNKSDLPAMLAFAQLRLRILKALKPN